MHNYLYTFSVYLFVIVTQRASLSTLLLFDYDHLNYDIRDVKTRH